MGPTPADKEARYGFVGIIAAHAAGQGGAIQRILSEHSHLILGRMGLPHLAEDRLGVITLIVHASPAQLGSLTGQLGRLRGVSVKSGLGPGMEALDWAGAGLPGPAATAPAAGEAAGTGNATGGGKAGGGTPGGGGAAAAGAPRAGGEHHGPA